MRLRDRLGRAAVSAIGASRAIRPRTRAAEVAYRQGLRFRTLSSAWDDAQRREWMLRRLRSVVRHAARDTAFYRQRFQACGFDPEVDFSFDDFAQLPVLEREDVLSSLEEMLSPAVPLSRRRSDSTGGSTGVPLRYVSGPQERGWRTSGQDEALRQLGVPHGVSRALLWGHHIDQAARTGRRARLNEFVSNERWYDCFRLSSELLLSYHEDLSAYQPQCLTAYASALDALATTLLERGLRANYPEQRILTGGEKLWPHQRARIESVFAAPVHEQYGGRDVGLIAMQYAPRTSPAFTVDFANAFVEPATDERDTDLLITKLHADAMPMIRYRIGDVARFPAGSRPGHPALSLEEVIGRKLDGLYLPDGGWLHGIGIPHLFKDFSLREFQVLQNADYSVVVRIVPNAGLTEDDVGQLARVMRQNLPALPISIEQVAEIPRTGANKWRPVVSLVPADAHAAAPRLPPS